MMMKLLKWPTSGIVIGALSLMLGLADRAELQPDDFGRPGRGHRPGD